jgi:hypothetical protein
LSYQPRDHKHASTCTNKKSIISDTDYEIGRDCEAVTYVFVHSSKAATAESITTTSGSSLLRSPINTLAFATTSLTNRSTIASKAILRLAVVQKVYIVDALLEMNSIGKMYAPRNSKCLFGNMQLM